MDFKKGISHTKILGVEGAVRYLQPLLNKSCDEVLRKFIASETYDLIQKTETRMWAESAQYLGEWYLHELQNKKSECASETDCF